jgi:nucleotidyltransferase substrate binding protein (TIGR01987 family)
MGAIQAFEVSYELAWKTLQKFLAKEGKETHSPRETFRLAAQFGYLDDPKPWFKFGEERNLTAHTYREDVLTELLSLLSPFVKEFEQLIKNLEKKSREINS